MTTPSSPSDNWAELPLSEAVQINPSIGLKRGEVYPFVDMASVDGIQRTVNAMEEREFKGSGSKFQHGDTLMARITPCLENGKIAQYKALQDQQQAYGSTEFIVLRGRLDTTTDDFVYYLTRWEEVRQYAIGQMTGTSGRQRVPVDSLDHLTVPVPPIPVQRRIADILGALDDKIDLNRRMNETLEQMARALYKSWFVDFDPVHAKMDGRWQPGKSLPGLPAELYDLFSDRLVASELGEIPEGWEANTIADLATIEGGSTPSTKIVEYWEQGTHCWATPKDLSGLTVPVLLETNRKITDAGLGKIGSGLQPPGTVLLSSRAPVGYLAINEVPTAINQGFIAIRPKSGIPNHYLLHWCADSLDEILNHANGSTFLEISKSSFRSIRLAKPNHEVLEAYEGLASNFHQKIVDNEQSNRILIAIRDSLLPELISGGLRVQGSQRA